jgi:hypothetical protein
VGHAWCVVCVCGVLHVPVCGFCMVLRPLTLLSCSYCSFSAWYSTHGTFRRIRATCERGRGGELGGVRGVVWEGLGGG